MLVLFFLTKTHWDYDSNSSEDFLGFVLSQKAWALIIAPASQTFVAKIKFHGRRTSGYSTASASMSGVAPVKIICAVISAFNIVKFHNTSYKQIIVNPSNIS